MAESSSNRVRRFSILLAYRIIRKWAIPNGCALKARYPATFWGVKVAPAGHVLWAARVAVGRSGAAVARVLEIWAALREGIGDSPAGGDVFLPRESQSPPILGGFFY